MSAPEQNPEMTTYRSPFVSRWASRQMLATWSEKRKFTLWRSLWIALAEAQKELGLDITEEQIQQLKERRDEINFDVAAEREKEVRHDVMAHVYAYGIQCPEARPIIHLGATSCFVTDNADLILMRDSLRLLVSPLSAACRNLAAFARRHKDLPCLGRTHFQPAQLTTVGKRACLWLQDLLGDLQRIAALADDIPFRGAKGATGTQASFLSLFDGDAEKVGQLEQKVAEKMGFARVVPVTGQTYPRKLDYTVLSALGGFAISAHSMAVDIRLLAGLKEMEEPFGKGQVGSSAMAYKRNPMRCERMTGLCRFIISNVQNAAFTAADQWLERTLDDSANRRLSLAQGFLAADSVVGLARNVTDGLVVYPEVMRRRIREEMPFIATERILMEAVKAGGDRQELHDRIRQHSMAAARRVKEEGADNDLLERLKRDEAFAPVAQRLESACSGLAPEDFVGLAPLQVERFLDECVEPALANLPEDSAERGGLKV